MSGCRQCGNFVPIEDVGDFPCGICILQNLRVSASTYVYAVAMGEVLSAEVNGTANVRMETLGQFQDIFERRRLGDISDIYIRCIDYKREFTTTEEKLMRSVTTAERIADVMEGLLFTA